MRELKFVGHHVSRAGPPQEADAPRGAANDVSVGVSCHVKEATMVTKSKAPATRRSAARRRVAAVVEPIAEAAAEAAKPNLIRAGLKALDKARQDVAQRQSRVFEAILGLEPAQGLTGLVGREGGAAKVAAEAFGLRKFEAVFDQRVVHALERMGAPSPEVLKALIDEVAALKEEVRSLKAATRRR